MISLTPGIRIDHVHYGKGKVITVDELIYTADFGKLGIIELSLRKAAEDITILTNEPSIEIDMDELESTLIRILNEYSDLQKPYELGSKWQGGTLVLKPGSETLKSKEVPIETFFHKIVMVRDRLRVLEQNINSHPRLNDEDKINLQQYITRIYGSLTTFNVLFQEEEDHFVGDKKGD
jgi:hypothetical protein